jgi:hypothetical protein
MPTYNLNDVVKLVSNPTQTGIIIRLYPLGVQDSLVVMWDIGPDSVSEKNMAYFCDKILLIEPNV